MHAVTLTVAEVATVGAIARLHPFPMAVGRVAVLPYVHKVVFVDVALMIVGTDAGTRPNRAVGQHAAHRDACLAGEEQVAHFALVVAQEALATVVYADFSLCARSLDIIKHAPELFVCESHHGVLCSPAYRENGEEPPALDSLCDEETLDVVEVGIVATVDAGDDVEEESLLSREHVDGLAHHAEALFAAPHPVVVLLQSVEADGHRPDTGSEEPLPALGRQVQAVGHHAPGESLLVDGCTAVFEILSHQRLSASDDDTDLVRIGLPGDGVEHAQKVLLRHVLTYRLHLAVATTVAALQVASLRTLPEELSQRVLLSEDGQLLSPEFEADLLPKRQGCRLHLFSS